MVSLKFVVQHDVEGMLEVTFNVKDGVTDARKLSYPYIWLRDNCLCSQCYEPHAKGRLVMLPDLNLHTRPSDVKISADDTELTVIWDDDHVSQYDVSWIYNRRFADDAFKARAHFLELPTKLWGSELQSEVPSDNYDNVVTHDGALYKWISTLEETGIILLTGTPPGDDSLGKLAERVAYLRKTIYGTTFQVKHKVNPSNAAYTSAGLSLHTDLPQTDYVPGIQMLNCVAQSSVGGDNEFVDGFHVVEKLRNADQEAFIILTTTPCDFIDIGQEQFQFHLLQRRPVICCDASGRVIQVHTNHMIRDSYMSVSAEQVSRFYRALKAFYDLLYAEENIIRIKLNAGDMICFNNSRVLHGRSQFRVDVGEERHLVGGYIDWDELRSKRRVLELSYNLT